MQVSQVYPLRVRQLMGGRLLEMSARGSQSPALLQGHLRPRPQWRSLKPHTAECQRSRDFPHCP